jgi:hypothetical protein
VRYYNFEKEEDVIPILFHVDRAVSGASHTNAVQGIDFGMVPEYSLLPGRRSRIEIVRLRHVGEPCIVHVGAEL